MSDLTNPELIDLLACPACEGELVETGHRLVCSSCKKGYEIRQGIPVLYPSTTGIEHLREEEDLAIMMKDQPTSRKDQFNLCQWNASKKEFWGMVEDMIESPPKVFLNVGCGYDPRFSRFEQEGYTFVNFDIVFDMVYSLQRDLGAKSCVAGAISNLPFKKESFDYLVCIDVLHHEADRIFPVLEAFKGLLKPGGLLFLEDPNAWGMFQMAKSVFLPRPLYRFLRSTYHKVKRSSHRPSDYEFPTSVWRVRTILEELGFEEITVYANNAYPGIGEASYRLYKILRHIEVIRKYHNYHYMLSAVKLGGHNTEL
jgi:SAM-dependent methyltransferase/uncharacterized protein YbaR (Trm112 family)